MKLWHQFVVVSILILIAVLMKCTEDRPVLQSFSLEDHLETYEQQKDKILKQRARWQEHYEVASVAERQKIIQKSRDYLNTQIPERLFEAWYGTRWNFHGTTQTPRKGSIACGYFVTTTLVHAGFKLPRVKMAQQAASVMIKSICDPKSIKTYTNMEELMAYLKARPDGLFILGLDKHVGYIYRKGDQNYFIHSSLANDRKVVKERLEASNVVKRSRIKMVGDLTGYDWFIEQWLEASKIVLKK